MGQADRAILPPRKAYKGMVNAFVKGIQFYADNSITIEFRYMNEFEELLQECERIRKGVA